VILQERHVQDGRGLRQGAEKMCFAIGGNLGRFLLVAERRGHRLDARRVRPLDDHDLVVRQSGLLQCLEQDHGHGLAGSQELGGDRVKLDTDRVLGREERAPRLAGAADPGHLLNQPVHHEGQVMSGAEFVEVVEQSSLIDLVDVGGLRRRVGRCRGGAGVLRDVGRQQFRREGRGVQSTQSGQAGFEHLATGQLTEWLHGDSRFSKGHGPRVQRH